MIWPSILSSVALFVSFHSEAEVSARLPLSRFQFFWSALVVLFLYTWIPQYFFVALQSFSIICFLSRSRVLNFLASASSGYGIGLGALSLDFYYIGGETLTNPYWATLNMALGGIFWAWIVTPLLYFNNAYGMDTKLTTNYYADGTPTGALNTPTLFNSTGHKLKAVSLYMLPSFDLNEAEYKKQSPIYITSLFAVAYATNFLSIMAAFVVCPV
jgi:OPT oligopeptide transporter protein